MDARLKRRLKRIAASRNLGSWTSAQELLTLASDVCMTLAKFYEVTEPQATGTIGTLKHASRELDLPANDR